VVIGGGFGGLWTTRALAGAALDITLVDRANHHLFQPLLYQVATAGLSAPDIAAPLRHILRDQANVRVLMAEVSGIDVAQRQVLLADGQVLGYEQLVVASGATHAYFGHDDWAPHAPGLKTLDDALLIRRRLLLAFERAEAATSAEEQQAWLHFAVVGGGPTGVELAGTLAEIARHTLRQEFRRIDPHRAQVRLIEAGPALLASFPPPLQARTRAQLESLGVQVMCGTPVAGITGQGYRLGADFVPCRTVLWAAGVAASPLGALLGAERDRVGRVKVNADLTLPGHPEVFVVGDLACVTQGDGRPVPGVAPAAKQMGSHAAATIRSRLRGEPALGRAGRPFVYADYGNLATIGRMAAVVDLRGLQFSGLLAWWFWLAAHVFFLIGFRNRITVLINWAWAYWTYQRGARIVLGAGTPASGPRAEEPDGANR
jgi:NADH dehydrogenase